MASKKRLPAKRHQKKKRRATTDSLPYVPPNIALLGLSILSKVVGAYVPEVGDYVGAVRDELERQSAPVGCTRGPDCRCDVCDPPPYAKGDLEERVEPPPRTIKLVKGEDGVYREETS